jgi:hypothetical protein
MRLEVPGCSKIKSGLAVSIANELLLRLRAWLSDTRCLTVLIGTG